MFSQSHTELMHGGHRANRLMSLGGNNRRSHGRLSCGAPETGVILSDWQGVAPPGTVHHLEDITAEVDEREEYSNDFESSRGTV